MLEEAPDPVEVPENLQTTPLGSFISLDDDTVGKDYVGYFKVERGRDNPHRFALVPGVISDAELADCVPLATDSVAEKARKAAIAKLASCIPGWLVSKAAIKGPGEGEYQIPNSEVVSVFWSTALGTNVIDIPELEDRYKGRGVGNMYCFIMMEYTEGNKALELPEDLRPSLGNVSIPFNLQFVRASFNDSRVKQWKALFGKKPKISTDFIAWVERTINPATKKVDTKTFFEAVPPEDTCIWRRLPEVERAILQESKALYVDVAKKAVRYATADEIRSATVPATGAVPTSAELSQSVGSGDLQKLLTGT